MIPSRDIIEASYLSCRRMNRRAGSSFHAGFLLLPRDKRRAMDALYAFMRHTDDLADNLQIAGSRRQSLLTWRACLQRAFLGDFQPLAASQGSSLLPALADAVKRFHIPHEHLTAVIDGVEMDLDRRRYETFDDLRLYCQRVASAVGLACIYVWGFRGPEAFEPARQAGVALQLTNILRDLKDDAASDRVYLPLEDLRHCGYAIEDLGRGLANDAYYRLIALEVDRAEQFYREGTELMQWLEPDGRRIFGLMTATYHALLRKIAHRPAAVFRRHVRLSGPKRLQLALRWALLPPRRIFPLSLEEGRGEGRPADG